jgi:hypothetical protein
MTAQIDLRPETDSSSKRGSNEISRKPRGTRKPRRGLWLIVLLIAMTVAGVVGVAVAANVTDPPAPTRVVYPEPNANSREGRVPATQEPNANDREGRVPTTEKPSVQPRVSRPPHYN